MRALEEKREWFADSSRLRADVPEGVGFYSAPDLGSAIAGRVLGWGESVEGTAVRSWLRVDGAFLPLRIGEVPVLRPAGAPAEPPRGRQTGRADPDPVVARLAAWLEDECGATGTARLFVGLFDKAGHPVRGIGVAQDVPRDEYAICVPRRCAISPDDAQSFLLPSDVDTASCDSLSRLAFWMALEQEKGDASEWAPHFAAMPTEAEYKTYHPGSSNLDDMSLAPEVDVWQWWLDALKQCHGGRAVPTYEAMKLQYVRLITRQFEEVGLVPLADMPNTGPPGQNNVQQTYNDEGHFCLTPKGTSGRVRRSWSTTAAVTTAH
ncbi:unnamed protein product [Prorocentrum cordatum]|uniref:Uncharacterized protein n=1 Tax=Prorocentrum cordatum TaxID=2364126 RepID=A0ABN9PR45_9DINO|nr:unnamed protein product [Polarella glacialis]